jgi:hypothetical protein
MLVLPVACGTGDEAAFSNGAATQSTATEAISATTGIPSTTASEITVDGSADGSVFPTGGELLVSFTYEPSAAAQAKRPYVAVWVENIDGELIDTISLWFDQGDRGSRWLDELRQWYSASGGTETTMSGATRVAGDYTVAWDGTDAGGDLVVQGDYVLFIEAAREHGPYSITSGGITVSDEGFTIVLDDDGELSAINAELAV